VKPFQGKVVTYSVVSS